MCPSRSLHPYFFRTALQDFAATNIFMTSVDTGCVLAAYPPTPPPLHTPHISTAAVPHNSTKHAHTHPC
jgi:hypothetical protein